jgi:hypothetical protein
MLPTGLFIDSPEMNDVSLSKLSQDPNSWAEEIIQKLKERVPQSNGLSMIVKFLKKDDEHGTATGAVTVNTADKQVSVPIIIREFMLYPLDVMLADQKILPLTPDYFMGVFQSTNPFLRLEEYPMYSGLHRFEDSSLWQAHFPPGQGRYAYASAGYTILDNISGTIGGEELRKAITDDPTIAVGFSKHGHADVIKKLANLKAVNMNEFRQSSENLIPRNIAMLRAEGPNKYTILSNSDEVFSPATAGPMDRHSMYGLVSQISDCVKDTMNEVDSNGEKMLYLKQSPESDISLELPYREKPVFADEFDHYRVIKKDGVSVEGVVIPKVINFDMSPVNLKVFLGKTMGTVQEQICGVRLDNSSFKLKGQPPRTGQTGVFVYMSGENKALATLPVTIKAIADEMGDFRAKVVDLQGHTFNIRIGGFYQQGEQEHILDPLKRIAKVADGYVLPNQFFFVPMEGFFEVSSNEADYMTKVASQHKTATPVTLISTGHGQYSMKGVDKYASAMGWDKTNLEGWQAKFLLASLGAGEIKTAALMKEAKKHGASVDYHMNLVPLKSEKIAKAMPTARRMIAKVATLKQDTFKLASQLENAQTVDAVLSLNFINPDNIAKFVGFLPRLKATISNLCGLLMAARLGIS